MLLLGGFAIAGALSKHNIAKTLASSVLSRVGQRPGVVLLANMLMATFCSMWIRCAPWWWPLGSPRGLTQREPLLGACSGSEVMQVGSSGGVTARSARWLPGGADLADMQRTWQQGLAVKCCAAQQRGRASAVLLPGGAHPAHAGRQPQLRQEPGHG